MRVYRLYPLTVEIESCGRSFVQNTHKGWGTQSFVILLMRWIRAGAVRSSGSGLLPPVAWSARHRSANTVTGRPLPAREKTASYSPRKPPSIKGSFSECMLADDPFSAPLTVPLITQGGAVGRTKHCLCGGSLRTEEVGFAPQPSIQHHRNLGHGGVGKVQSHRIIAGRGVIVRARCYCDGLRISHQKTNRIERVNSCGNGKVRLKAIGAQHLCPRETDGMLLPPIA